MRVYFVRHGQSELNASSMHQGPKGSLSEQGRTQARYVGRSLKNVPIDTVITSPFERTQETTNIILEEINITNVIESDLFREIVVPSTLQGKSHHDPESIELRKQIWEKQHDLSWRHSDEESMGEVITRCQNAVRFLESQEGSHILVVTHGSYLKVLLATIILGPDITVKATQRFREMLTCTNTGITMLEKYESGWRLLTWNDHTHLQELGV